MKFQEFDLLWSSAMQLMPRKMDSREANAMLYAIGLQESSFSHRHQVGGPAHGFWQFEQAGGAHGVIRHQATAGLIATIMDRLCYPVTDEAAYTAIEHNDILALCFARLLLYTDPRPLPARGNHEMGWAQYQNCWRPGKPHKEFWQANFDVAWARIP